MEHLKEINYIHCVRRKRPDSTYAISTFAETTSIVQELYDKMLELNPNRINPDWTL